MKSALFGNVAAMFGRFGRDERGVSAIEAALLMPFMITLYFGGIQISQAVDIGRKTTLVARTLADLTAQVASIDSAGVDTVLNAGTQVMSPYADGTNASKMTTRVTVIKIDAQLKATVEWSKAKNGSGLGKGSAVTVPADLATLPNSYLVLGEATYVYTPPVGEKLTGTITLGDKIYMRPRLSTNVTCANC